MSITSQGQVVGAAVGCTLTASLDNGSGASTVQATANSSNVRISAGDASLMTPASYLITIHQVGALHTGTLTSATTGMSGSISNTSGSLNT